MKHKDNVGQLSCPFIYSVDIWITSVPDFFVHGWSCKYELKKIPGVKEMLDSCERDRYFQWRSCVALMETEDAGMMHNDTLWNPRAVRLQEVWKQDMKYPGPGLGDHLSFFPFHSFFFLCLISFSLSPSSHLTTNGPPTAGWPTIVCEVIL